MRIFSPAPAPGARAVLEPLHLIQGGGRRDTLGMAPLGVPVTPSPTSSLGGAEVKLFTGELKPGLMDVVQDPADAWWM